MVAGISSLLALADEDDGGGVAGKSDVVHCFFSCSTVDEEEDGGTCLAVVVRLEPSAPKECALRGIYIKSEKDSASAARLPMVALDRYMHAMNKRAYPRIQTNFSSTSGRVTSFPNDEILTWMGEHSGLRCSASRPRAAAGRTKLGRMPTGSCTNWYSIKTVVVRYQQVRSFILQGMFVCCSILTMNNSSFSIGLQSRQCSFHDALGTFE